MQTMRYLEQTEKAWTLDIDGMVITTGEIIIRVSLKSELGHISSILITLNKFLIVTLSFKRYQGYIRIKYDFFNIL